MTSTLAARGLSLAAAALLGLALTGCTNDGDSDASSSAADDTSASSAPTEQSESPTDESGQSVTEACAQLGDGLDVNGLQEAVAGMTGDPAETAGVLDDLAGQYESAAAEVSNTEVSEVISPMVTGFSDMAELLRAGADDPASIDAAELEAASSSVVDGTQRLGELCGGTPTE